MGNVLAFSRGSLVASIPWLLFPFPAVKSQHESSRPESVEGESSQEANDDTTSRDENALSELDEFDLQETLSKIAPILAFQTTPYDVLEEELSQVTYEPLEDAKVNDLLSRIRLRFEQIDADHES